MPCVLDTLQSINPNLKPTSAYQYNSTLMNTFTLLKGTEAWDPAEFEALDWVENYEDVIECLRKCFETEELSMDTIRSYYNALILVTKRKPNYECLPEFCAYTTERRSMAKVIRSVKTAEEPIPYEIDNIIEELEKRVRPLREKYPLTLMEEDAFMEFLLMKIFKHFPEDRTRYAGMTVYSRRNYDGYSNSLVIDKDKLYFRNEPIPKELADDLVCFLKKMGGRKYLFLQSYIRQDRTRKPITAFNIKKMIKRIFTDFRTLSSLY
jgi:hypothetical protein